MKRHGFTLGTLVLALSPVHSQEPTANPSLIASAAGVRDAAHARDIAMRRFDVAVRVHGAVAETTIIAEFANEGHEVLEGDFRLALPKDAVVTGYALDIGGALVDGVWSISQRPRRSTRRRFAVVSIPGWQKSCPKEVSAPASFRSDRAVAERSRCASSRRSVPRDSVYRCAWLRRGRAGR